MWQIALPTIAATQELGKRLGNILPPGSNLLLSGELGAGKTTLVQGLGQGLGISEAIVSPTFALIHEYSEGRIPLYHFDLYRLAGEEIAELAPEIYWEASEVSPGIVAIEWAQRLPYRPDRYLEIQLDDAKGSQRQAKLSLVGVWERSPLPDQIESAIAHP